MVRDGGQWNFYHIDGYPSALGVTSFYTLGTDTVIEAQTYKKVLCREKVDTAEEKPCPWGLREDEKRLYLYDYTTQKEHVLCDFSLRPGDTLVTDWPWVPPIFVVEKVGDTILPGGDTPLRYLAVRDARHHGADIWVEKIGPLHYGISWGYLWMAVGVINELLCYSDNGNMCYQNPTYKNCYIHYDTGTFRGKIVSVPAPLSLYTEGKSTFGLKVDTITYTLAPVHINFESFTFGGKSYAIGDSVEVSGLVYNEVDDVYEEFLMLGVQSISKYETGNLCGKIVYVPDFYIQGEIGEGAPYAIFGLKAGSIVYVLTNDSVPLFGNGNFEVVEQVCSIGDSVEILGHLHTLVDDNMVTFSAFEIEKIKILSSFFPEKISGTYTGRLVLMPNPATEIPVMPGLVMGLQCNGKQYVLSKIGWLWSDYVVAGGVHYEEGDSVEIKGILSTHIDLLNNTYFELEIDTIRKITALAQQEDFFTEGKTWSVIEMGWPYLLDSGYTVRESENMRVDGEVDTLGFVWKRIVHDNGNPLLYRQDGQKIYGFNEFDSIYLHFDFGLQKGDTVLTYNYLPDYYVVDSVFETTFGQEARRRKCLAMQSLTFERVKDIWVEGIGSLSAGMLYNHSRMSGGRPSLLCVEENGSNLYRNPEYNTCRVPAHLSYDYSVQKWSVLCREVNDIRHTELLYFKENGRKKWIQAYCTTREDFSDEKPYGLYYQDILQVYFKENENDTAELLYDFGLEKGEGALCAGDALWVADSVYYMEINNSKRRCLRMISESGETDIWVEGIGSLKRGFFPAHLVDDFAATELLCTQAETKRGQVYTYQNEQYNSCYIAEETSTEQSEVLCAVVRYEAMQQSLVIVGDVKIDRLEVFDAQGRGVMTVDRPAGSVSVARLPRGLYLYRLTAAGTTLSGKFVR
ncbi:T9SS type A sorting domain-containing protein [bacterium]|nr:T9SS type A sorting domain-containing protein [bacterium]